MTRPYHYQLIGARLIHKYKGRCLLADSMGLGKSLQVLLYAHRHPHIRPVVILCPASLKWNWQRECAIHFRIHAEILESRKPTRLVGSLSSPQFLIINYEILKDWLPYLKELNPQLVIIDEGHYLGSRNSQRTKCTRSLCSNTPHVVVLTGTPFTNRPAELWSILNILYPDDFPSFFSYAFRHCAPRRTPFGWEFKGATRLDELHKKISRFTIRRLKEDVLRDLPAKRRSITPLQVKDYRQYKQALNDFLGWLIKHKPSKIQSALRAQAVVQMGYLKRLAARLKLPAVMDWVDNFFEESDGKLVLFAIHRKIIKRLEEKYSHLCVVVDGSVTGKKRQQAVDLFQRSDKVRLFIGNIKAAGVGINLTAAQTLAFAEMGWTPGEHIQAEDRIHRIGQDGSAWCNYLVAKGTIEETLAELIQKKQKTFNAVLDGGGGDNWDIFDQLVEKMRE